MIAEAVARPQTGALVLRPQDRYHTRLGCSAGILPAVPRASRPRRGGRGRPPDSRRDGGATRIHCVNLQTVAVLALLCLLVFGQRAQAEEIQGVVTDSSGAVIVGAVIQLRAGDQVVATARTDSKGSYALRIAHEQTSTGGLQLSVSSEG